MRWMVAIWLLVVCGTLHAQFDRTGPPARAGLKPLFGGIVDLTGNDPGNLTDNPNLDKPWVDGVRWREHWDVIQPTSLKTYDWSNTDAAIAIVAAKGKKLTLSIAAGIYSSPAIYSGKNPCTLFRCDTDGDGVDDSDMPFPDANYLVKWDTFVYAMGAKYDKDPNVAMAFITGMGQQVVEFHVTKTKSDEKAWESLAVAARYKDKSAAIQAAAQHVVDTFLAAFPNTPLLFTTGNPWQDDDGVADQQFVEDDVVAATNGRTGICDSFLKAMATHTYTYSRRDYPFGEQAIYASYDSRFYADILPPWPREPRPVFDLLQNGAERGDQYVELYEYDLNGGAVGGKMNDQTISQQRLLVLENLP